MNIFEALEAGNGKATLYDVGITQQYVQRKEGGQFYWITPALFVDIVVDGKDLKRNDWRAYVPRETPEVKCGSLQNKTLKAYYALCLQAAEAGYSEEMIGKIITRPDKHNASCEKNKSKEVFENVIWLEDSDKIATMVVYPYCMGKPLAFKPFVDRKHTKVMIEWEE